MEDPLGKQVYAFREWEFKGYVKGFILDSRRLAWKVDLPTLHLIAEYVPEVFWRKLREARINVYVVDGLLGYYTGPPEKDTPLTFAEDFLVVNSLFWRRFERKLWRKASRARPTQEYYMAFGAFYYQLSYERHGMGIYKIMSHYYRPIVEELREIEGG